MGSGILLFRRGLGFAYHLDRKTPLPEANDRIIVPRVVTCTTGSPHRKEAPPNCIVSCRGVSRFFSAPREIVMPENQTQPVCEMDLGQYGDRLLFRTPEELRRWHNEERGKWVWLNEAGGPMTDLLV